MTNEVHLAYLSLGSNIEPLVNLPRARQLLSHYGQILKISSVWESHPVGGEGGNYLNACLSYATNHSQDKLKSTVLHPIEASLGRKRSDDKFAPRTIDIDIIVFDDLVVGGHWLAQAFVVIPLAEIHSNFIDPTTQGSIVESATRLRRGIWMETRPGVLSER